MNLETIEGFIKETHIRLECDDKWLVWDGLTWNVYSRTHRARQNTCHYEGNSFEIALTILTTVKEGEND